MKERKKGEARQAGSDLRKRISHNGPPALAAQPPATSRKLHDRLVGVVLRDTARTVPAAPAGKPATLVALAVQAHVLAHDVTHVLVELGAQALAVALAEDEEPADEPADHEEEHHNERAKGDPAARLAAAILVARRRHRGRGRRAKALDNVVVHICVVQLGAVCHDAGAKAGARVALKGGAHRRENVEVRDAKVNVAAIHDERRQALDVLVLAQLELLLQLRVDLVLVVVVAAGVLDALLRLGKGEAGVLVHLLGALLGVVVVVVEGVAALLAGAALGDQRNVLPPLVLLVLVGLERAELAQVLLAHVAARDLARVEPVRVKMAVAAGVVAGVLTVVRLVWVAAAEKGSVPHKVARLEVDVVDDLWHHVLHPQRLDEDVRVEKTRGPELHGDLVGLGNVPAQGEHWGRAVRGRGAVHAGDGVLDGELVLGLLLALDQAEALLSGHQHGRDGNRRVAAAHVVEHGDRLTE
mmetsp:Transcript_8031/g.25543  ORF Transcript_8031/g.25543 Transcript_8031/m.25543 type:complete len:469 (+) Transcript_8031:394-1800(+)